MCSMRFTLKADAIFTLKLLLIDHSGKPDTLLGTGGGGLFSGPGADFPVTFNSTFNDARWTRDKAGLSSFAIQSRIYYNKKYNAFNIIIQYFHIANRTNESKRMCCFLRNHFLKNNINNIKNMSNFNHQYKTNTNYSCIWLRAKIAGVAALCW